MWAVGINRPYYPSVEFFQDKSEAVKEYELLKDYHEEDGNYDVRIFIAKIEDIEKILTYY